MSLWLDRSTVLINIHFSRIFFSEVSADVCFLDAEYRPTETIQTGM